MSITLWKNIDGRCKQDRRKMRKKTESLGGGVLPLLHKTELSECGDPRPKLGVEVSWQNHKRQVLETWGEGWSLCICFSKFLKLTSTLVPQTSIILLIYISIGDEMTDNGRSSYLQTLCSWVHLLTKVIYNPPIRVHCPAMVIGRYAQSDKKFWSLGIRTRLMWRGVAFWF